VYKTDRKYIKRLRIKLKVRKMSLEMMLENNDVCNVANVCWNGVPNR